MNTVPKSSLKVRNNYESKKLEEHIGTLYSNSVQQQGVHVLTEASKLKHKSSSSLFQSHSEQLKPEQPRRPEPSSENTLGQRHGIYPHSLPETQDLHLSQVDLDSGSERHKNQNQNQKVQLAHSGSSPRPSQSEVLLDKANQSLCTISHSLHAHINSIMGKQRDSILAYNQSLYEAKFKKYFQVYEALWLYRSHRIQEGTLLRHIKNKIHALRKEAQANRLNELQVQKLSHLEKKLLYHYNKFYKIKNFMRLYYASEKAKINSFKCYNERLTVLNLIGCGGFGEVFRCYDSYDCEFYALKIMFLNTLSATHALELGNVEREVLVGRKYAHCHGIVPVYGDFHFFNHESRVQCIVTKVCNNHTVDWQIKHEYLKVSELEVVNMGFSLLRTLWEVSQNTFHESIVHYDIKPSNILIHASPLGAALDNDLQLGQKLHYYLADWGLCIRFQRQPHADEGREEQEQYYRNTNNSAGTYWYLAPEAFKLPERASMINEKLDVWAVGCVMYEYFSKRRPFCADFSQDQIFEQKLINKHAHSLKQPSGMTAGLFKLVQLLLTYNPHERPSLDFLMRHSVKLFGIQFDYAARKKELHAHYLKIGAEQNWLNNKNMTHKQHCTETNTDTKTDTKTKTKTKTDSGSNDIDTEVLQLKNNNKINLSGKDIYNMSTASRLSGE